MKTFTWLWWYSPDTNKRPILKKKRTWKPWSFRSSFLYGWHFLRAFMVPWRIYVIHICWKCSYMWAHIRMLLRVSQPITSSICNIVFYQMSTGVNWRCIKQAERFVLRRSMEGGWLRFVSFIARYQQPCERKTRFNVSGMLHVLPFISTIGA